MCTQAQPNLPFIYNNLQYPSLSPSELNRTIFDAEIENCMARLYTIATANHKQTAPAPIAAPVYAIPVPAPRPTHRSFTPISIHVGDNNYGIGNGRTEHHHHHHHVYQDRTPRDRRNDEDNKVARVVIGLVMSAVAAIGSYVAGTLYKDLAAADTDYKDIRKFREKFENQAGPTNLLGFDATGRTHTHAQLIFTTLKAAEKALYHKRADAIINVAIAAAVVVGAVIAVVGAVTATEAVMITGCVIAGVSALAALFKWAMGSFTEQQDKHLLQKVMVQASTLLNAVRGNFGVERELWFPAQVVAR